MIVFGIIAIIIFALAVLMYINAIVAIVRASKEYEEIEKKIKYSKKKY